MVSDVFKVIAANAKHIEVGFLTNRGITISAVDSSFVSASLVLETSTSIDRSPIRRLELGHQENVLFGFC